MRAAGGGTLSPTRVPVALHSQCLQGQRQPGRVHRGSAPSRPRWGKALVLERGAGAGRRLDTRAALRLESLTGRQKARTGASKHSPSVCGNKLRSRGRRLLARNSPQDTRAANIAASEFSCERSPSLGESRMIKKLPPALVGGERARLFPILADTSKEGRTLSIFLACLENVPEFGRALLGSLDLRLGARASVESYAEVVLRTGLADRKHRPDGLLLVDTSRTKWTALVEAKVGAAELTNEQIESYLELARLNGVNAVITLSNQFTALPTHHPLTVKASLTKKVDLFHWSWGYVITQAHLLTNNGEVRDREQLVLLKELQRFLLHPSSGVKEFDQMPVAWANVCSSVAAGASPIANAALAREVVGGWHQLIDQLTTQLSRQIDANVRIELSRQHAGDPSLRVKESVAELGRDGCLRSVLLVPDAAAPIEMLADLKKRSVTLQMGLKAPADRKSTKAKVAWLLRQLSQVEAKDLHIRLRWPGRATPTQYPLADLLANPDLGAAGRETSSLMRIEILMVKDLASRFGQRKNFVSEFLAAVPEFYDKVAENLRAWQPRPPKLPNDKVAPDSVSSDALREELELESLDRPS